MKKTDKIAYRQKGTVELEKQLVDLSKKLIETQAKLSLGSLKDTSQPQKIRYQIALIHTLINEKQNDR